MGSWLENAMTICNVTLVLLHLLLDSPRPVTLSLFSAQKEPISDALRIKGGALKSSPSEI